MRTLIADTNNAATVEIAIDQVPVTLVASGLGAGEQVTLSLLVDGQSIPVTSSGSQVALTDTDPVLALYAPGRYQLDKPVTAAPVSVRVSGGRFLP